MEMKNAFARVDFWLSIVLVALMFAIWLNVWPYNMRGYDFIEGVFKGYAGKSPALLLAYRKYKRPIS